MTVWMDGVNVVTISAPIRNESFVIWDDIRPNYSLNSAGHFNRCGDLEFNLGSCAQVIDLSGFMMGLIFEIIIHLINDGR